MPNLLFPATAGSRATDIGLLILRLIGGLSLALAHGLGKVPPSERFIGMVGGLGMPMPHVIVWGATAAEFLGGLLLAFGFLTRPAAALVSVHFLFVSIYVHRGQSFGDRELPVLFLMMALTLLFTGAGRYSVDGVIGGRRTRT